MADQILLFQPEATPLLTLTAKLRKKREAVNPQFQWLERDEFPRFLDVTAAYDSNDTAISVTAGQETRVYINCVVQNLRTGELILITAAPTSGSLGTVVRGIGGTGQADGVIGDRLLFVFNAIEDGADTPLLRSVQENTLTGRTQIFRTAFGFTGRDLQVELYGGRDEVTETKAQSIEHKRSIEYAAFFGKVHRITSGDNHQTFSDGLDNRITSNRWNVIGTPMNERSFIEFLEAGMRWGKGGSQNGSSTKYLFAPGRLLTDINSWANNKLQYRVLDDKIGFSAMEYVSPHGKVMLLRAPLLDYYHPDRAYLVDLNHMRYVYMRGRDTKLLYDRQGNGIDGKTNEYITDAGFQVEFQDSHAAIVGIS
jgi:hypothetical protein